MAKLVPVSRERHGSKAVKIGAGLSFASSVAVASLVGAEFASVARSMPIGLLNRSGKFEPVAVMSFIPQTNFFVSPSGRWVGVYMPAIFRTYPFRLVPRDEEASEWLFCVDEESTAVADIDDGGDPFYDQDGNLSAALKNVLGVLQSLERNRIETTLAVTGLAQAGVIRPWDLVVKLRGEQNTINGLYRIDEAALESLDGEAYLRLRSAGAIGLAYSQIVSAGHVETLERLASARCDERLPASGGTPSEVSFAMSSGDSLRFE